MALCAFFLLQKESFSTRTLLPLALYSLGGAQEGRLAQAEDGGSPRVADPFHVGALEQGEAAHQIETCQRAAQRRLVNKDDSEEGAARLVVLLIFATLWALCGILTCDVEAGRLRKPPLIHL